MSLKNDIADTEIDLKFGQIYSGLIVCSKLFLFGLSVTFMSEPPTTPIGFTELIKTLCSPMFLSLHMALTIGSVYFAKRSSGHKGSLALPHHTKPLRGDPTKGPFIRRTVLRIKGFIFRISPLKTVLHAVFILTITWTLIIYITICFGAPVWSEQYETSTFGTLVLILAILPIILVFGPETDSLGGLMHVVLSQQSNLKVNDPLGHQLFVGFCGAVLGSWAGAFPIPLDWDRPWQKWPVSCAAGALFGSLIANLASFVSFKRQLKRYSSNPTNPKKKKT